MTTPIDTTRLRADLEALVADLLTQDNAATADPYYTVQQRVRDWGFEEGYGEDGSAWIFDGDEVDPDAWLEDTGEPFDTEAPPDGAREVTYRYRWEHVQAFLTQDAALAFMDREKHNHGPLRTWVESACRNPQMRLLRELPAQALALLDEVERLRALVATREVNVREWCAVHRPDWLAQLPAIEPEEGGTR